MTARRYFAAVLPLLSACGAAQLVTAPRSAQPANAQAIAVDYPPPPARIEEIPLAPHSGSPCVWRDGFWDWTGRRWEWLDGRAVLVPKGCRLADSQLEWSAQSLSFYRPAWYPDPAQTPPPKSCLEVACIPAAGAKPTESE
ncbi:MAG TPA: hypothetical protein VGM44_19820 [Polyangiaceae bacterium]